MVNIAPTVRSSSSISWLSLFIVSIICHIRHEVASTWYLHKLRLNQGTLGSQECLCKIHENGVQISLEWHGKCIWTLKNTSYTTVTIHPRLMAWYVFFLYVSGRLRNIVMLLNFFFFQIHHRVFIIIKFILLEFFFFFQIHYRVFIIIKFILLAACLPLSAVQYIDECLSVEQLLRYQERISPRALSHSFWARWVHPLMC